MGKWFAKLDVREHGSGNAGATNTLRVLGVKWAVLVLVIDIFKGMVAVLIARWLGHGSDLVTYLSGIAVIVGHNWPVFFGFRGGKGVATTIGVLLLTMFQPTLLAFILCVVLIAVTRYVSLGSLAFMVFTPVFALWLHPEALSVCFAIAVAILSIYRHRTNIVRLLHGQEHRIFSGDKSSHSGF